MEHFAPAGVGGGDFAFRSDRRGRNWDSEAGRTGELEFIEFDRRTKRGLEPGSGNSG